MASRPARASAAASVPAPVPGRRRFVRHAYGAEPDRVREQSRLRLQATERSWRRHLLRRGLRLRRRLRRRARLPAALAELVPVVAQLVAPVLALERPQLFVVRHLRRVLAIDRRQAGLWIQREVLLAAGDLVREAQRLSEQLAQLAPLLPESRDQLAAGRIEQRDARLPRQRSDARDQRRIAEDGRPAVERIDLLRQL